MASSLGVFEIWVKQGVYKETITMMSEINIFGGFDGAESSPDDRNLATHPSIIDAEELATPNNVVTMNNITNTILDGFTITGGCSNYGGGGIHCDSVDSANTIANCIIDHNHAKSGGGIYLGLSSPKISNCQILWNESNLIGGGVFCTEGSTPVFTGCILEGNRAENKGGGILCRDSVLTIRDSTIRNNHADFGAGLCADIGQISVTNSTFSINS